MTQITGHLPPFAALALLLAACSPPHGDGTTAQHHQGLPWQVAVDQQGQHRVFDITLGHSTLAEVRARHGDHLQLGLLAEPGETGALEAYYTSFKAGFLTGRLILSLDAAAGEISAMRERAVERQRLNSGAQRYTLAPVDVEQADQRTVRALTFLPTVPLDENLVRARFGPPGQRRVADNGQIHLLYPERGLDLVLDPAGPAVLQYVAPEDFTALLQGLPAVPAATGGSDC